jgi:Protein of unknown function (DUF2975)
MNRGSILFLKAVLVLVGVGALALLLWEPHVEGRNAHATLFEMYFQDPFLAYVYIAFIPFFVALYQAFKILGYAGHNTVFSHEAVMAVRTIKYCAITMIGFVAVSLLFMVNGDPDDRPAGLFMRILITFPALVVATTMVVLERVLQNAVDLKSESDLTV